MSVTYLEPIEREEQQSLWDYEIDLTGSVYRVVLTWSDRLERWRMDIFDVDGVIIVANRFLNVDYAVGARSQDPRMPLGMLFLLDADQSGLECGFEELGFRCLLSFTEADQLPDADGVSEPASIAEIT